MTVDKDIDAEGILEGLADSLDQALEAEESGRPPAHARTIARRVVDIPALRALHGLTQQEFADAVGISVGTLRNWEQGRRRPEGPAQRLLEMIADLPDVATALFHGTDGETGHDAAPRRQNDDVLRVRPGRDGAARPSPAKYRGKKTA